LKISRIVVVAPVPSSSRRGPATLDLHHDDCSGSNVAFETSPSIDDLDRLDAGARSIVSKSGSFSDASVGRAMVSGAFRRYARRRFPKTEPASG
jgi:hypothetical protein